MSPQPKSRGNKTAKAIQSRSPKTVNQIESDSKPENSKTEKSSDVGGGHSIVILKEDGRNMEDWLENCRRVASALGGDTYAQIFINGKKGTLKLPTPPAQGANRLMNDIYKSEITQYVKAKSEIEMKNGKVFWAIYASLKQHNRILLKEEYDFKTAPKSALETQDLPKLVALVKKVHNTDGSGDLEGRYSTLSDEWHHDMAMKKHERIVEMEERFDDHINARDECQMYQPAKEEVIRSFERSLSAKFTEAKRLRSIAVKNDPKNNKAFKSLHQCAKYYKTYEDNSEDRDHRRRSQEYLAGYHTSDSKQDESKSEPKGGDRSKVRAKANSTGSNFNNKPRSDQAVKDNNSGNKPRNDCVMCKALGKTGDAARHWASECSEITRLAAQAKAETDRDDKRKASELVNAAADAELDRYNAIIEKKARKLAKKMVQEADMTAMTYQVSDVTLSSTAGLDPRFAVLDTGSTTNATGNANMIEGGRHGLERFAENRAVQTIGGQATKVEQFGDIIGLDDQALFSPDFHVTVISGQRIDRLKHLSMVKQGTTYVITNHNTGVRFPFRLHKRGLFLCDMRKTMAGERDDSFEAMDGEKLERYSVNPRQPPPVANDDDDFTFSSPNSADHETAKRGRPDGMLAWGDAVPARMAYAIGLGVLASLTKLRTGRANKRPNKLRKIRGDKSAARVGVTTMTRSSATAPAAAAETEAFDSSTDSSNSYGPEPTDRTSARTEPAAGPPQVDEEPATASHGNRRPRAPPIQSQYFLRPRKPARAGETTMVPAKNVTDWANHADPGSKMRRATVE